MSFYADELARIEDVELFLAGASLADLGYEEMSLQFMYDLLEIKRVRDKFDHRRVESYVKAILKALGVRL